MSHHDQIRLAVVGAGRGRCYADAAVALGAGARLAAVCDVREEALAPWRSVADVRSFDRLDALLADDRIDAIVLATPAPLHARQAIQALAAGKHVLSEVPSAYSLDECADLVAAVDRSGLTYMLGENYCFRRDCMMVEEMVRRGVFGDIVSAEGHYIHDCRELMFHPDGTETWRGEMFRTRRGNIYPTHSLGPVARWLDIPGSDRFARLSSWGSRALNASAYARRAFGDSHPGARPEAWSMPDRVTTVLGTERGVIVTHHFDPVSPRPHHMADYQLQGTRAAFTAAADAEGDPLVWIAGKSPANARGIATAWDPLWKHADEFEHPSWRAHGQDAMRAGHGGGDFFVLREFVDAIRGERLPSIDVRAGVAWSCISALSAASIAAGNATVAVPDVAAPRAAATR
ncbi:MAG: Gfo/Idh/MocA family oxidoreductase [Planctomycetes bacterium]|nr:Gfo/Idh/MocA family oxidoreductase [Planctomycetota bacterium]